MAVRQPGVSSPGRLARATRLQPELGLKQASFGSRPVSDVSLASVRTAIGGRPPHLLGPGRTQTVSHGDDAPRTCQLIASGDPDRSLGRREERGGVTPWSTRNENGCCGTSKRSAGHCGRSRSGATSRDVSTIGRAPGTGAWTARVADARRPRRPRIRHPDLRPALCADRPEGTGVATFFLGPLVDRPGTDPRLGQRRAELPPVIDQVYEAQTQHSCHQGQTEGPPFRSLGQRRSKGGRTQGVYSARPGLAQIVGGRARR